MPYCCASSWAEPGEHRVEAGLWIAGAFADAHADLFHDIFALGDGHAGKGGPQPLLL